MLSHLVALNSGFVEEKHIWLKCKSLKLKLWERAFDSDADLKDTMSSLCVIVVFLLTHLQLKF